MNLDNYYTMRDEAECVRLAKEIQKFLEGHTYFWVSTSDDNAEIDMQMNHHLEPNLHGETVSLFRHEGRTETIQIYDSYGIHSIWRRDLRYVYINKLSNRIEIWTDVKRLWSDEKLERRHKIIQIVS